MRSKKQRPELTPRERSRTDLRFFARHYFPHHCRLPWSPLHEYLFERREAKTAADRENRRGEFDVVLAPRGAAKSTLVSLIFPIHAMLYQTERYILLISATDRQASSRLDSIRAEIEHAERLTEDFEKELKGKCNRTTERTLIRNGVKIDAFSAGSELRGLSYRQWRPTWIVLDDVESSARVISARYRERLSDWLSEVIENLGDKSTNLDLIGTLLHREALPATLAERPDVTARKYVSIMSESRDSSLWEAWRKRLFNFSNPDRLRDALEFYEANRAAMDDGAEVLWPERESYYDLQLMRATRGRLAFDKEKQNSPIAGERAIFNMNRVPRFELQGNKIVLVTGEAGDYRLAPQFDLADVRAFGYLDPSMGQNMRSGDLAAIVTVGMNGDGILFVLDAWLARVPPSEQIEKIYDLHAKWNYQDFGVEAHGFQKLVMADIDSARNRRRELKRPWDLRPRGVSPKGNKVNRISAIEPVVAGRCVWFSIDLPKEFWNQMEDFPLARHDDGPDALEGAIRMAQTWNRDALMTVTRSTKRRGVKSF